MPLETCGSGILEGQGIAMLDARVSLDPGFAFMRPPEPPKRANPTTGIMQSEVAYKGLSVRMVIATGTAEGVKYHRMSRRMEYEGQVRQFSSMFFGLNNQHWSTYGLQ